MGILATMKTEEINLTLEAFEAYCARQMPDLLKSGPEAVREAALAHFRGKCAYEFLHQLAQGWRPSELAEGKDFRTEVYMDGSPKRPSPASIPPELEALANQALREANARALSLNGITEGILANAATRNPQQVEAAVTDAMALVRAFDGQRQNERNEADRRPTLHVAIPFRAKTKSYAPGQHRIGAEEAADLEDWRIKTEQEATLRGWEVPSGFAVGTWPPFWLEGV